MNVKLERETGEIIQVFLDSRGVLHRILFDTPDDTRVIRYIDPYGDTVFNRLQIADLLADWADLGSTDRSLEEVELLDAVAAMVRECAAEPGRYLRFVGD